MGRFRAIVAVLIALAVAIAPLGVATAAVKMATADASHGITMDHRHAADHAAQPSSVEAMPDCEKMAGTAGHSGKSDCPCCEPKAACPPDLCPMKIFKVFGVSDAPNISPPFASLKITPDKSDRPPDWIDSPQPPPPRT